MSRMNMEISLRRRVTNVVMLSITGLFTLLTITVLFCILGYLLYNGIGSLSWSFFTKLPKPTGEVGGGMANAIVGSGKILLIAQDAGGPIGVVRFDSIADGRAEVSINVNPERRGQRLGQAALVAACGHAFSELGLTQLSADIRPDNAASIAIFTRIGFGFQGVHEGLNTYRLTPQQFRQSHSEPLIS